MYVSEERDEESEFIKKKVCSQKIPKFKSDFNRLFYGVLFFESERETWVNTPDIENNASQQFMIIKLMSSMTVLRDKLAAMRTQVHNPFLLLKVGR